MSILTFSFKAIGDTRDVALEEIDKAVRETLTHVGGEPWLVVTDDIQKVPIKPDLSRPDSYIYVAKQEVVFAGPTVLGEMPQFRDGFRPQSDGGAFDGLL